MSLDNVLKGVIVESAYNTYEQADIFIKDGIINKTDSFPIDATKISSQHFLVTPGFVNSHLHPNQLLDRRMLDNLQITNLLSAMHTIQQKDDNDRYNQAICVLFDAIKSGATSIYAVASKPEPVIRAFKDIGVTGAISCFFNDVWDGEGNTPAQISLEDVEKSFREYFKANSNEIKIHIGSASILTASNDLLILFDDIANRYGAKVNIHISEGMNSVETCFKKRGATPIRLLDNLGILNSNWNLIHATSVDYEEIEIIASSGASVIHCPVSNAKTGVGVAPVLALHKNGVNIAIGTDACSNNNTNNILNEAYFACLLQSALHKDPVAIKEETIFGWLNANGLKIIDSFKNGKIEVGQRADLLLWSLEEPCFAPLPYGRLSSVFINNAPDVKPHTVLLAGQKVVENYKVVGQLEAAALDGVNEWARRHSWHA